MTYKFNNVYINNSYSLLASTKYNPIIKDLCDKCIDDYYLKCKSIELCESKYQELAIKGLLNKENIVKKDIDLIISGDLQNQILASTLASSSFNFPMLGVYSACASFVEGLLIASMFIENNQGNIIVSSSSHNLVSEKQFRFPVEYGAIRKRVNTSTASGSVCALLSSKKSNLKIESVTIGHVVQTNHKDANDMGAAMAPSCALTLSKHLMETGRDVNYYDLILTGDLGIYGLELMKSYFKKKSKKDIENVMDSGSLFYTEDNVYAGASGPVCLPFVFFDYILKTKKYKKILLLGTGSLHSVVSCNLSVAIPSITHAISVEVLL